MKYGQSFINDLVLKRNQEAEKLIQTLARKRDISKEDVYNAIEQYLRLKFSLDKEELTTENILILARISIKKAARKNEIYWDRTDCHGATESMTKKVLFITSIEKNLEISFSQDEYYNIDTIADLADAVYTNTSKKGLC
ncbi:MAG: hypothetical protein ACOX2M_08390 [Fastidiosipilaceae bacterium]|jgi:hypothetical protein